MPRGRKKRSEKTSVNILKYPQNIKRDTVGLSKDLLYQLIIQPDFKTWTLTQHKLLALLFSSMELKEFCCGGTVNLRNEETAEKLGWELCEEQFRNVGSILRANYKQMTNASEVSLPYDEECRKKPLVITENLINGVEGDAALTRVEINRHFTSYMRNTIDCVGTTKSPYVTFIQSDILDSTCQYTPMLFYTMLYLWNCSEMPYKTMKVSLSKLKAILGMEQDAYMQLNDKGERTIFSKYCFNNQILTPIIDNISKSETIALLPWEDGKLFKVDKVWGCLPDYSFKFRVRPMKEIIENREKALEAERERRQAEESGNEREEKLPFNFPLPNT